MWSRPLDEFPRIDATGINLVQLEGLTTGTRSQTSQANEGIPGPAVTLGHELARFSHIRFTFNIGMPIKVLR